jgi:hypothetical protein
MTECKKSEIIFDTSTLERIVNDPQWVLDNQDAFWSTERAQILVRKWAEMVNFDIPYDQWREKVTDWGALPSDQRTSHEFMRNARRIINAKDEFLAKALPHNCGFLPEGVDLSVTVQFTAFVPPFAFAYEDIVIDVASKYWKGNPEHILNLLVHEIFHVGYSFYRTIQNDKTLVDETIYKILDNIVCEGICTYVGYCALPVFPIAEECDYRMLDDMDEVRRLVVDTNMVLSRFGHIPESELNKLSWDKGVVGRAYYVSGSYICKTIDKQLGRQALIDGLSKGPISIIDTYNALVDESLQLHWPKTALHPS